jgi:hypothetical protein
MSKFESVRVPFLTDASGRRYLTGKQLLEDPYLRDFVDRFKNCFEHDMLTDHWIFIE